MNIFILDEDPKTSSQYLCDQHVNKMILETVQILCDVALDLGQNPDTVLYKHTKGNQLPQKWILESKCNWFWVKYYLFHLHERYRGQSFKNHKSYITFQNSNLWGPEIKPITPFPLTWNDVMFNCWNPKEPVESHRRYYFNKYNKWLSQGKQMTWNSGTKPEWI
jgi:hypothetical protein